MSEARELAAPCGTYCGACPLYRAASDAALAERLAKTMNRAAKDVACKGCRAQRGIIFGSSQCDLYACFEPKGLEFCYECSDFPCLKLAPCADRATESPHNMKVYNLAIIEKRGVEALAGEARDGWRRYFRGKKIPGQGEPQL